MRYLFTLVLLINGAMIGRSQDPEFSQYYAAPLYLNPAFTGTSEDHRFISNYRNQWPNIATGYQTFAMSYDYNLLDYNSGIGFMAMVDKAGTAGLKSTELDLLYSYKLRLSRTWVVSSGLNFGYGYRSLDLNRLIFGDQLQFDADGTAPSSDPVLNTLGSSHYFNFNAGALAYNKSCWFGFATSHLNEPNRSLINEQASIPIKTTIHGGFRIPLDGPFKREHAAVLSPSFVYKHQGRFDQLDVGTYFLYDPVVLGLWYRGIPLLHNVQGNISQDAVVVILGFIFEKLEVSYSYDLTVSALGPISGGTHEVAIRYKVAAARNSKSRKKEKLIPCPAFMHRMKQ
jgi:type IX secretion system PorP/SprF family membrane protein